MFASPILCIIRIHVAFTKWRAFGQHKRFKSRQLLELCNLCDALCLNTIWAARHDQTQILAAGGRCKGERRGIIQFYSWPLIGKHTRSKHTTSVTTNCPAFRRYQIARVLHQNPISGSGRLRWCWSISNILIVLRKYFSISHVALNSTPHIHEYVGMCNSSEIFICI